MTSEPQEVRLAGGAQGFNWLPVFLAEELGLFARHGIRITWLKMGSVDKATSAVREGAADLAITPPEGALADYVRGGGLRMVAANALRLPMSLVAAPGIRDLAGLRGKRIGTSSLTEGTAIYTQMLLAGAGLHFPGDYDFVLAGIHTKRWEALQAGEIDCAPQPAPWNFLAEKAGYNLIGEIPDAIPETIFTALIADAGWIEAHPDLLARVLAALAEGHAIANDPARIDAVLPVFQRITTPEDRDLALKGLVYMRDMGMWPAGLAITDRALDTAIDLMIRADLLAEADRAHARGAYLRGPLAAAL